MKKTIIIVGCLLMLTGGIAIYHVLFKDKIAFVDLSKVYDKFEMKVELEKKIDNVSATKKNILDSLKLNLELNYKRIESMGKDAKETDMAEFNYLKNEYYKKTQNFEESNQQMIQEYDKQIWTQLNQYVKEFGKANDYDIIMGADGSGSVMYGKENKDITETVLEFVNGKYKGIK